MATRYWVGGSGTWDASTTTNWSATSGGAGGASAPVAADTVVFDSASGTGTCTTASGSTCTTATLNSATLGLTLGANHTMTGTFTLTKGALDLNNLTLNTGTFVSIDANTRSIAFGSAGVINITGNNTTIFTLFNATVPITITGTSTVNCTYSGSTGTRTIRNGNSAATAVNVNVTSGTDIVVLTSGYAFLNLNFTGFAGSLTVAPTTIYGNLAISTGMTIPASTSAFTFAATSGIQQITTNGKTLDFPITQNSPGGTVQLQDNLTMGSTRTFTLTAGTLDLNNLTLSTGFFGSSNSNTRSIAFGTGKITVTGSGSSVWECSTATNLTFTGTSNVEATYAGSTGTRLIRNGQTAGGSATNAVNIKVTAGSDAVTVSSQSHLNNVDFTGYSGALSPSFNLYGNLTFSATQTIATGNTGITFAGTSGTQLITMNGVVYNYNLVANGIGGTFAFQDAFTQLSSKSFTITNGTVKFKAGTTNTVGSFITSGTNQKYLQSTTAGSQATLSQASGTVGTSYLTIQDINATGGATWNSFYANNNVDAGNNTNWNFGGTPSYDAEYGYKLRSFTERGRF
jgi:hypothetical protein